MVSGIGLAVVATTAYNAGLVLEKRALAHLPAIDVRRMPFLASTLLTAPAWLMGFAITLCGLACQVVVLTIEPVTVVQPVLACGVVVVLVLSHLVLRERLHGRELWCMAVMAGSVVLLALSDSGSATGVGRNVSSSLMAATAIPSCLLGLLVGGQTLRAAARKHRAPVIGVSYGIGTGLLYGVAALAIKDLSGTLAHSHSITGASIAIASSPYLYLMAGCTGISFGLFQTALQRCRASIVVPISTITGSVYFMVAGTWLFHEHLPSDPVKLALRVTGILVAGAVLILLPQQATATRPGRRPGGDSPGVHATRRVPGRAQSESRPPCTGPPLSCTGPPP